MECTTSPWQFPRGLKFHEILVGLCFDGKITIKLGFRIFMNFHYVFNSSLLKGNPWNLLHQHPLSSGHISTTISQKGRSKVAELPGRSWYITKKAIQHPNMKNPGNFMPPGCCYAWLLPMATRCEVDPVPWAEELDKQPEVQKTRRFGDVLSLQLLWVWQLFFYLGREYIHQQKQLFDFLRCLCLVVWCFVFFHGTSRVCLIGSFFSVG